MNQPLVSVIIPVFNAERFLDQALKSVLSQNYAPLEVIVVDDGSTDSSAEIVKRYQANIRYINQENGGPAAARNRGLEVAAGSFIAFQDADDVWPERKVEIQLPRFEADPSIEIVMGHIQRFSDSAATTTAVETVEAPCLSVNLGASIFRRSVFQRVGTFNETMRYSEDVDWFMRARELNVRIEVLESVTLLYRLHDQNMTREKTLSDLNTFKVLKMSLDRRRCESGFAKSLGGFRNAGEHSES